VHDSGERGGGGDGPGDGSRKRAWGITIGLCVAFALLTAAMAVSATRSLDSAIVRTLGPAHWLEPVRPVARRIVALSNPLYVLPWLGVVVVFASFGLRRALPALRALVVVVPWLAITVLLRHVLPREEVRASIGTFVYPSGHTGAVAVTAGLLVLAVLDVVRRGRVRVVVLGALLPATTATSLLITVRHGVGDVVGALLLAGACVAVAHLVARPLTAWLAGLVGATLGRSSGDHTP
jgi:hypothetical protein